jgi:hypothetical protein
LVYFLSGASNWVFSVDMDEFVHHPDMRGHLEACRAAGVTICIPQGYQMVGQCLPKPDSPITQQIRRGRRAHKMSKPVVFNPDAIEEMNFRPGAHRASPAGKVVTDVSGSLKLLHYHWLSLEWVMHKHTLGKQRLSEMNKQNGWGREYMDSSEEMTRQYEVLMERSFDVFAYVESAKAAEKHALRRTERIRPQPK